MPKRMEAFLKSFSKTRRPRSKNDWKKLLEYNKNSKKAQRETPLYQMLLHLFPEPLMPGICSMMDHKNQRKRGMIKILVEEMREGVIAMIAETTDETAWREETIVIEEEMTDEVTVIVTETEETIVIEEEMTDAIIVTEETIVIEEEMTEEVTEIDQWIEETTAIEMTEEIPIGATTEEMIEGQRERMISVMKEETTEDQMIEGNRVRRALQEMILKEENLQALVQVMKTMAKVPKSGQRRSDD
jgi:hypothetical protein